MPTGPKLRFSPLESPFDVVLVEPEIPPNTGAVARTCAATRSPLHLVGTLGFSIDDHAVRRAGVDYWHLVEVHRHADLSVFRQSRSTGNRHYFSANAVRPFTEAPFQFGDALIFGCESTGLPPEMLEAEPERVWGIPTCGGVRSLNLSNAVSIVLYEALRKVGSFTSTYVEKSGEAPTP